MSDEVHQLEMHRRAICDVLHNQDLERHRLSPRPYLNLHIYPERSKQCFGWSHSLASYLLRLPFNLNQSGSDVEHTYTELFCGKILFSYPGSLRVEATKRLSLVQSTCTQYRDHAEFTVFLWSNLLKFNRYQTPICPYFEITSGLAQPVTSPSSASDSHWYVLPQS